MSSLSLKAQLDFIMAAEPCAVEMPRVTVSIDPREQLQDEFDEEEVDYDDPLGDRGEYERERSGKERERERKRERETERKREREKEREERKREKEREERKREKERERER